MNKWRNRLIAVAVGVVGTCVCLTIAISRLPAAPTPTTAPQPTQADAVATEEPAATKTKPPTLSPVPTRERTATPQPTRTQRPSPTALLAEPSPTRTLAPAFTATSGAATAADTPAPVATEAPTLAPAATEAPTVAPPAGDTITLVALSSPINAGADASLVIQTTPGASCFLAYTTPAGNPSGANGLGAATADGNGRCGWSWRISSSTTPGTGKLFVSAGTANASFDIVIQ